MVPGNVDGQPLTLRLRSLDLAGGTTHILGVVNVTPDSFSDGGLTFDPELAVAHGRALATARADVHDVGGESTPPPAPPDTVPEKNRRVLSVVAELARIAPVSIDTCKAEVAAAALSAGAELVNDVSGGRLDPEILRVAARGSAALILGHWRVAPAESDAAALHPVPKRGGFTDVAREVTDELGERVARAVEAGVPRARILVDPGLGFGKSAEDNLALLAHLGELSRLGLPIVIGASRKAFLGKITGQPIEAREVATAAAHVAAILAGAKMVRVHDVAAQRDAIRVADAIRKAGFARQEERAP